MKSYIHHRVKYLLYGMAIQALVTASLSFFGQIEDPQPKHQALAGLIFFVLAILIGITQRMTARQKGEGYQPAIRR